MFIIKKNYYFYIDNTKSIDLNSLISTKKIILIYRNNGLKETNKHSRRPYEKTSFFFLMFSMGFKPGTFGYICSRLNHWANRHKRIMIKKLLLRTGQKSTNRTKCSGDERRPDNGRRHGRVQWIQGMGGRDGWRQTVKRYEPNTTNR